MQMAFPNPLIAPAGDLTKAEIVNDSNLNVVNRNRSLHNRDKKAVKTAEEYTCGNPAAWGNNPPNTQDLALDALAGGVVSSSALVSFSVGNGQTSLTLPANVIVTEVIADVQVGITTATDFKVNVGATTVSSTSNSIVIGVEEITAADPVKVVAGGAVSIVFTGVPAAGKVQIRISYYVSPAAA
jgi:hypothetical protein